jgi:hypothetical protein
MSVDPIFLELSRSRLHLQAELSFPCLPSRQADYLNLVAETLRQWGKSLESQEYEQLDTALSQLIQEGFTTGPFAQITIKFTSNPPPEVGITCDLSTSFEALPIPDRAPEPDAKVREFIQQWYDVETAYLVILGAGKGQNVSPLRDRGFKLSLWEWRTGETITDPNLETRHFLDPLARLKPAVYDGAIATNIPNSIGQTPEQLRLLIAKLCDGVKSGGQILLGLWITETELAPEWREWLQWQGAIALTLAQLTELLTDLPVKLLACELAVNTEAAHRMLSNDERRWFQGETLNLPSHCGQAALHWLVWQRL